MKRRPQEPSQDRLDRFLGTDDTEPVSPTRWLWLFGFWTALPLLMSVSGELIAGRTPTFPGWVDLFYGGLYWWAWAASTPLVVTLGRRFPLRGRAVFLHIAVHVLASWLLAIAISLFTALATYLLPVEYAAEVALRQAFHVGQGLGALSQILYWLVLATATAFAIDRSARPHRRDGAALPRRI